MTGRETPNLVFKDNVRTFSKNSITQKNIEIFKTERRLQDLYKKVNWQPEIKPMIENLQH